MNRGVISTRLGKRSESQASYICAKEYPAGARVRLAGSGDMYQVQDDGSLRSSCAVGRKRTKRERREARGQREHDRLAAKGTSKERPGGASRSARRSREVEGTDALPDDARAADGERAPLAIGTLARGQPET